MCTCRTALRAHSNQPGRQTASAHRHSKQLVIVGLIQIAFKRRIHRIETVKDILVHRVCQRMADQLRIYATAHAQKQSTNKHGSMTSVSCSCSERSKERVPVALMTSILNTRLIKLNPVVFTAITIYTSHPQSPTHTPRSVPARLPHTAASVSGPVRSVGTPVPRETRQSIGTPGYSRCASLIAIAAGLLASTPPSWIRSGPNCPPPYDTHLDQRPRSECLFTDADTNTAQCTVFQFREVRGCRRGGTAGLPYRVSHRSYPAYPIHTQVNTHIPI